VPVIRVSPSAPPVDADLLGAIAQELMNDQQQGPVDAPYIEEEEIRQTDNLHVTVLWDNPKWARLSPVERSRVILAAYEQVRGASEMLRITIALGLTHEEAARLGVVPSVP
jgi:hypothetical protein